MKVLLLFDQNAVRNNIVQVSVETLLVPMDARMSVPFIVSLYHNIIITILYSECVNPI